MKKLLLLILPFLYLSCDKIPSGTVDYSLDENLSVGIGAPEIVVFNQLDSSITINLKKYGITQISEVWVEIYNPKDDLVNKNNLLLLDNGLLTSGDTTLNDNVYSVKFALSRYNINGKYRIEYFIKYTDGKVWKAAYHTFTYYNNQQNYPPVISNLIAADTLTAGLSKTFSFALKVWDPNGSEDIKRVFFQSFRPDGTTNGFLFDMLDDGINGDITANDGVYYFSTSFPATVAKGNWTYVFTAIDWSDSSSNIISHNIWVK